MGAGGSHDRHREGKSTEGHVGGLTSNPPRQKGLFSLNPQKETKEEAGRTPQCEC